MTVVVTVKYVCLVLRADNDGEGEIMALAALVLDDPKAAANPLFLLAPEWARLLAPAYGLIVMTTWQRGRRIISERRAEVEGPLRDFVERMRTDEVIRVSGTAVFPHPTKETTPLALRNNVEFNEVMHQRVVIASVVPENVPHVPPDDRLSIDDLGYTDDGIVHLSVRFGFHDEQAMPAVVRDATRQSDEEEAPSKQLSRSGPSPPRRHRTPRPPTPRCRCRPGRSGSSRPAVRPREGRSRRARDPLRR